VNTKIDIYLLGGIIVVEEIFAWPGLGRLLIALSTVHLFEQGVQHVVFTATRALSNAFTRLGVPLADIGAADPRRVPGGEGHWGDYYRHDPRILAGRVASGLPVAGRLPD
jgi:hypothetical protein